MKSAEPSVSNFQVATLAGGCFWCTEAVFKKVKGVISVMPGYAGGRKPDPTYEDVATGRTGHAESIQITFDPTKITFGQLLDIFWQIHDPTTLNRQGNDVGPQYRSIIFYHNPEQQNIAKKSKENLQESGDYPDPVVTEILSFTNFYPAEEYHRDFYNKNREYPYCRIIIDPKLQKLLKRFPQQSK